MYSATNNQATLKSLLCNVRANTLRVLTLGLLMIAGAGVTFAQDPWEEEIEPVSYDIMTDEYYYNIISKEARTVEQMFTTVNTGNINIPAYVTYNDTTWIVTKIAESSYNMSTFLTGVTIPENITSIGENAFFWCTQLATVSLPATLTSLGTNAFMLCSGLSSITLPAGLTSIGQSCFASCSSLTSINFPEGLTTLSEGLFSNAGFTSITIPSTVKTLEARAFSACQSLTSVTLSEGVTTVDATAFANCPKLTDVYLESTTPPAYAACVKNETVVSTSGVTVHVPASALEAYKASDWATYATAIVANPATGVGDIKTAAEAQEAARYTISGRKAASSTKGLNIVKMSDGSVKKVIKK